MCRFKDAELVLTAREVEGEAVWRDSVEGGVWYITPERVLFRWIGGDWVDHGEVEVAYTPPVKNTKSAAKNLVTPPSGE